MLRSATRARGLPSRSSHETSHRDSRHARRSPQTQTGKTGPRGPSPHRITSTHDSANFPPATGASRRATCSKRTHAHELLRVHRSAALSSETIKRRAQRAHITPLTLIRSRCSVSCSHLKVDEIEIAACMAPFGFDAFRLRRVSAWLGGPKALARVVEALTVSRGLERQVRRCCQAIRRCCQAQPRAAR